MIGAVLNISIATLGDGANPEHAWIYPVICRLFVGFGVTGMYSVDSTIIQELVPAAKHGRPAGLMTTMLPASLLGYSADK
jgi:MFS transporter, putative metabolite:H+ symporter